jgi:hypothetical protein
MQKHDPNDHLGTISQLGGTKFRVWQERKIANLISDGCGPTLPRGFIGGRQPEKYRIEYH